MSAKIQELIEKIESMKKQLGDEISKEEKKIAYVLRSGKVTFDSALQHRHKEQMKGLRQWFSEVPLIQFLAAPVIYGMVIPAVILDIALFVYTYTVSKIFKIKFVKRGDYVVFDRQYLGYLNVMEKLNCMYCSYFNGMMQYAAAIAGATELYFCPIKHAKKVAYDHQFFTRYFAYGDSKAYREKLKILREESTEK